jgi:hypothetical protein
MTLVLAALCLMGIVGCDNASDSTPHEGAVDGAWLLGLNRDHLLRYFIYDSIVTVSPDNSVIVTHDTTQVILTITRGVDNHVELAVNGSPQALVTIDDLGVLHSAQIHSAVVPPDTLYFFPTPIIMSRSIVPGQSWSYTTPWFTLGDTELRPLVLYLYYGYYVERQYQGRMEILLPTSSYDAYRFETAIYDDIASADTLFAIEEYYAGNVGLVKQVIRYGRSQRLILLLLDD